MKRAIEQALLCKIDVPVGAIIVKNGQIIGYGHNQKEELQDVTAHAEILAIREAQKNLGSWHLDDCDMYVTLEPCPMCGWAIIQSRIKNLYFGAYDLSYGAFSSGVELNKLGNSSLKIYGGIEEEACKKILDEFFQKIRKLSN